MEALVLWEVSRKQDYIFASSRLKENRGASIVIEYIIEELPKQLKKGYENCLIYNGGGNSLYKFDSLESAKDFVKDISEKVLGDYPGIQLFMAIEEYDDKKDNVIQKIEDVHKKLNIKKNRRKNSGVQRSFGIESICESTGLPACCTDTNDLSNPNRLISQEVRAKIENSYKDSKKFKELLPKGVKHIREFRDLVKGKEGEKNYLAVVHIDGNQMGKKFIRLRKYFTYEDEDKSKVNRKYLNALKKFSDNVKMVYEEAFKEMTNVINENRDILDKDTKIKEEFFPVIPIIVAGDDITYVTNGKIGIESARIFLEYLYNNEIEICDGETVKLNACAGVAIGRVSQPFANMYKMAEDLCNNGKKKLALDYPEEDFSLIDWHVEQGDILGNISEIRKQHYEALDHKKLCMRPLYLNNDYNDENAWRSYDNFKIAYDNITKREIYENKIARNKLKELREVLKKGEKYTEVFLKSNDIENYFGGFDNARGDYCFSGDTCMYFGAIEIMDLFIELKGGEERDG